MAAFGLALATWLIGGGAAATAVLTAAVLTAVSAAVLLTRRPTAMLLAQLGLWGGLSSAKLTPEIAVLLLYGGGVSLILAHLDARRAKTERRRQSEIERAQLRAEEMLAEYEDSGLGWFWETDRRGTIAYVSPHIGKLLGKDPQQLIGRPFTELFILNAPGQVGERTLSFHLTARSSFQELAVRAATANEERWWSINGRPNYDEFDNFLGFRGSGSDLTEKRRSQEHASRLAHYDSLTGLANRFQMSQSLEKILNARQEEHRACSVFLLDLDRFKQVNDTLGHPAGDALLKQVAQRLTAAVSDLGRVGRLGGDEFEVIIPGRLPRAEFAHLAQRIIESLSRPYEIDGHRVVIGASVGIATSPDDGVTSEAIIRNADLALYAAKDNGRGCYHFFAPDLHSDAEERRQLEHDLRDAIASGGLELYYQPVVQTTTEKITGFEALLRWDHPTKGPMEPARFVPIAEDAGLIAQIGEWALRTACYDLATWPESVRVAVNVSPLQFANPALPAIVTSALASAGIKPERLELEITESVFLNDSEGTEAMFAALKGIGVRLALDDFGTGYSALGYLKKAPFDKIKIDQSFVRGATIAGSRNGAIISSIVSLAEALGMETTAEGVETLDELDLVRILGCSHVQGFIYEKPLSSADAAQRLQTGLTAIAVGPKSNRAMRQTMLRRVVLDHEGERYDGTIRNISATGAMIEGLWNVPAGTVFNIQVAEGRSIGATARWSRDDRMGVEFASSLSLDSSGRVDMAAPAGILRETADEPLRKAG
jgi:diguanylate cyclase (GGDEF)-like protein/PAS domain S-box-containing protein